MNWLDRTPHKPRLIRLTFAYAVLVICVVAGGAIFFHDLYHFTAVGSARYTPGYHLYLRISGAVLGLGLGAGAALFGLAIRQWFQGLVVFLAGFGLTMMALAVLPWMYFPHDQYSVAALWVIGAGTPSLAVFLCVSIAGMLLHRKKARPVAS